MNGKTYYGVQQGGVSGNGADFSPYCRDNVVINAVAVQVKYYFTSVESRCGAVV